MFGLLQRAVQKDADTSDMVFLTVLWRSLDFFVVTNWFLRTDDDDYETSVILNPFFNSCVCE